MPEFLTDARVAVVKEEPHYARTPPFDPDQVYPEWPNAKIGTEANPAYRAVRQVFRTLGLDREHDGTAAWNPLAQLIKPGNSVVLKPNMVAHRNQGARLYGITDTDSLVTHGSVIRAVLDYAALALRGGGRIIIGDCPIQGTSWEQVVALIGLDAIADDFRQRFPGIELIVRDYRLGKAVLAGDTVVARVVDESTRGEYMELDIGRHSLLLPLMQQPYHFGVSQYPRQRMRAAHTPEVNKYLLHRDIVQADVMINLPKMKSHMKAGVTCALKNFVGVNGHKDYLPHFRFGSPKQGGDEYPDGNVLWDGMWYFAHLDWELDSGWRKRFYNRISRVFSKLLQLGGSPRNHGSYAGGGWHGNDTLWRTVLDIKRAYLYHNRRSGRVEKTPSPDVKYLAILDGLVGGEKESPLAPSPVPCGWVMAAHNPLALDLVATALMGLDWQKIPQISRGFEPMDLPLANFGPADVTILGTAVPSTVEEIYRQRAFIPFEPSLGYRGMVEYEAKNGAKTSVLT
ncbi:MAG: DUF362 domain-containing protein [Pirellulales bacterium]|nr:DUF362 domain-containing protein [Pirellulales bacterium]